jgi:hypothetical protein
MSTLPDPPLPGVIVDPGGTATITITNPAGITPNVYSDPLAVNQVTMPQTISARTTFYLQGDGPWLVNGHALTLEDNQVGTVSLIPGYLNLGPNQQGTLTDTSSWGQSLTGLNQNANLIGTSTGGSANQFTLNVQTYISPSSSSLANYEKGGILSISDTYDPSDNVTPVTRDCVGADVRGRIRSPNQTGRAWGLYSEGNCFSGADGLIYGWECAIINNGVDQSAIGQVNSKYGVNMISNGSVAPTCAIWVHTATGMGKWHKGLFSSPSDLGSGATDTFVELNGLFEIFPQTGQTVIGAASAAFTTTVLEARGPNLTADPLMLVGSTGNTQSYSLRVANGQGTMTYFVAGVGGAFLTDTAQGDGGLKVQTASRAFRMGGTSTVFLVNQANQLSFFNATAVGQQQTTGTTTGFTAGSGTAMNSASTSTGGTGTAAYTFGDVILALKSYGLLKS